MTFAEEAGLTVLAPPIRTPFKNINGQVQGPGGWQVTLLQLETLQERTRTRFATDAHGATVKALT